MPKLISYRCKDDVTRYLIEEMTREQLIEALTDASMQLRSLQEQQLLIDRARFESLIREDITVIRPFAPAPPRPQPPPMRIVSNGSLIPWVVLLGFTCGCVAVAVVFAWIGN